MNQSLNITSIRNSNQKFTFNIMKPDTFLVITYPQRYMCDLFILCILSLETIHGSHIKMETKVFFYKGYNCSACSFAGLARYDFVNKQYEEWKPICTTQDDSHAYRNIYSTSNKFQLIFYAYEEYITSLHVRIKISTTKCEKITVNACETAKLYLSFHSGSYLQN